MNPIMMVLHEPSDYDNLYESLKRKYPVDVMGYISSARMKLAHRSYSLIITELNMPSLGEYSNEETQNCKITGITWFKKELATLKIPILFWSNDFVDELYVEELKKEFPDNKIGFIKRDVLENDHLLFGVEEFLGVEYPYVAS